MQVHLYVMLLLFFFLSLSEIQPASWSFYRLLSGDWLRFSAIILHPESTVLPEFQEMISDCVFSVTLWQILYMKVKWLSCDCQHKE